MQDSPLLLTCCPSFMTITPALLTRRARPAVTRQKHFQRAAARLLRCRGSDSHLHFSSRLSLSCSSIVPSLESVYPTPSDSPGCGVPPGRKPSSHHPPRGRPRPPGLGGSNHPARELCSETLSLIWAFSSSQIHPMPRYRLCSFFPRQKHKSLCCSWFVRICLYFEVVKNTL